MSVRELRAPLIPLGTVAIATGFPYTRVRQKHMAPLLLLHQLQTSKKKKNFCLPIKYLGLNFSDYWKVLENNSRTC